MRGPQREPVFGGQPQPLVERFGGDHIGDEPPLGVVPPVASSPEEAIAGVAEVRRRLHT